MNDYFGKLLAKWEKRGWRSQDVLWPEDEVSHESMLVDRRLGDRWTWIIPLNNAGVTHANAPDSALEYSTFRLEGFASDRVPRLGHYGAVALPFVSMVLKHKYTNLRSWGDESRDFWPDFAAPRLERLSLMELWKVPPSSRPQSIQDAMDRVYIQDQTVKLWRLRSDLTESGIELPSYDHEIPGWYAEWERQQASRVQELDVDQDESFII